MNAQPHVKPATIEIPDEDLNFHNPSDAECLISAAELLLRHLEAGRSIDARILRASMEDAFGASDTEGAWVWKDAYEAVEVAQIMLLDRYGSAMQGQAKTPTQFLAMIKKLAALAPTHTRRSEEMIALQQFSTPLPLAAIAAQVAGITAADTVLEPSAGTGMLAIFAKLAGASLVLNELGETRAKLLSSLFPSVKVTSLDAASIDDRLDRSIEPTIVVMNPPFSVAPKVEGRFRGATPQHVLSALSRLVPGGRLVVITGANFNPTTNAFRGAFSRITELGNVVFSAPIAGRLFAAHGTSVDTRLTVIDKHMDPTAPAGRLDPKTYFPICDTLEDLQEVATANCPARAGIGQNTDRSSSSKSTLMSLRDAARAETRAVAVERAKHPFDTLPTIELDYQARETTDPTSVMSDNVYEPYALQAISIDGAAEHPTALVQSAAMASVAPPCPKHRPKLLQSILDDGLLSGPQLESVIYAGDAHATHLKGLFKTSEIEGQLVAAHEDDADAFRLRKGWFLGDGTGCGKGRQVAGIIMDNWLNNRRRAVWVSKSDKLLEDAKRDWIAIGGRESDIVPLAKFRQGKDIKLVEGILFVTYATLRSAEREGKASRLDQVVDLS